MHSKEEILHTADRVMLEAIRRGQSALAREVMAVRDVLDGKIPTGWQQELEQGEKEERKWQ